MHNVSILKGIVHPKMLKCTNYPLATVPMEGWVRGSSPQNTSGVSGVNSVAAKSNTIEGNGDQSFSRNKTTEKQHNMPLF